jgi:cysteinyl-tRNA synthetase
MRLYNTLGRQLQEFKPINAGQASLYTCGPTVYDYPQIGNLRSFVFDDTLRRSLEANGYEVRHVMNITDVGHLVSDDDEGEDKLEKGASREHKTVWQVADFYIDAFLKDIKQLNILEPNAYRGGQSPFEAQGLWQADWPKTSR